VFLNLGPFEILVLVVVALIVFGPDKLPTMAKDAGRMLRTLRDMAQGARTQLRDELGPEFADLDLRRLNPRTAIQRAIFDDDDDPPGVTPTYSTGEPDKPVTRPLVHPLESGERAPYDADAT
jgi:sec-independent protein translocase protein TatB